MLYQEFKKKKKISRIQHYLIKIVHVFAVRDQFDIRVEKQWSPSMVNRCFGWHLMLGDSGRNSCSEVKVPCEPIISRKMKESVTLLYSCLSKMDKQSFLSYSCSNVQCLFHQIHLKNPQFHSVLLRIHNLQNSIWHTSKSIAQ